MAVFASKKKPLAASMILMGSAHDEATQPLAAALVASAALRT